MGWFRVILVTALVVAIQARRRGGHHSSRRGRNELEEAGSSKRWYQEGRVARTILHQPYVQSRPVVNGSAPVKIGHSLSLISIHDHSAVGNIVTFRARVHQVWQDPRLTWDSTDAPGIDKLHFRSDDMWTPETEIFPSLDGNHYVSGDKHDVTVTSRGGVTWTYYASYRVPCIPSSTTADHLTCAVRAWTPAFQASEIALVPVSNVIKLEDYVMDDVVDVTDTEVAEEVLTRGQEQFSVLNYNFTFNAEIFMV